MSFFENACKPLFALGVLRVYISRTGERFCPPVRLIIYELCKR